MLANFYRVRIQVAAPFQRVVEGSIFTVSAPLNILAVIEHASKTTPNSVPTHVLLPISGIQSFTITSTNSQTGAEIKPQMLDQVQLTNRLDSTVARLKAEEARKGKGVSKEAQDIFDALSRTLPTRWDGKNIIVSDAVMILPPYKPDDCKVGAGASAATLPRVKKVVSS
jgi:hypothetical protein